MEASCIRTDSQGRPTRGIPSASWLYGYLTTTNSRYITQGLRLADILWNDKSLGECQITGSFIQGDEPSSSVEVGE